MLNKTVIFGSDHAGIDMKNVLMDHLADTGFGNIIDVGTAHKASCDYPVYAKKLCRKVREHQSPGILVCGSGIGMSMAANRIKGIRAALCMNEYMARMSRMHNNANVLCLGSRILGTDLAKGIVDVFLSASFEGGRHQARIDLIEDDA